jgi:hypothetical protein
MVVQKGVEVYLYSFSNLGAKLGWLVNAKPLQIYILERDPIPNVQGAGWGSKPVWACVEHLPPTGIRPPDRPGSIIRVHTGIYVCVYLYMCREAICCKYMNCSIESPALDNGKSAFF